MTTALSRVCRGTQALGSVSANEVSETPAIQVYDFFSGCGGTSLGLAKAGMEVVFALDMDAEALSTFSLNFPHARVLRSDIKTVASTDLEGSFERIRTTPILFSACAPCQPFSKQNRQKRQYDLRMSLLKGLTRLIERFRPELLFVENVPGLQHITGDEVGPFSDFLKVLDRLGYFHAHSVVKAQDYGVPQSRRRLILVASAYGPIGLPEPDHGPGKTAYKTVRDAISHLPALEAGCCDEAIPNHRASALSPTNLERVRAVAPGGDRRLWDERLKLECHRNVDGYTDVYGRMRWDRPSPALTTRCVSLSNGRFGHPEQHRAISVREAACLQTFPGTFVFKGSHNAMARQIGNAVPPVLAAAIGSAFIKHVRHHHDVHG